ncbi:MAG: formate dehydrogenase accessory sulfurtransferase FdhD [Saprospiraceae bacterium]
MMEVSASAVSKKPIFRIENGKQQPILDSIVTEEPLEIQIQYFLKDKWLKKNLLVTMRTPGSDHALALGFLFAEGIIATKVGIESIVQIEINVLIIRFLKTTQVDLSALSRNFYATASCGVCGKASIEKLEKITCFFPQKKLPKMKQSVLLTLPETLRNTQSIFEETGGIHAAGLFTPSGILLNHAEDVGRHNAVDKLIGNCLQKDLIPLRNHILMLSGRISFELVQKAMMAGIPIIAAVGAPSSLAIELAAENGMTLIGFLRGERFNVYCGIERIII